MKTIPHMLSGTVDRISGVGCSYQLI